MERTEQSGSKQVDNDKEVTVSACKGRKVATITTSTKSAGRKLLMVLANRALGKDVQDVNIRKV